MRVGLCYRYQPNTTAVYFERALSIDHEVDYLGPHAVGRPGYAQDHNLTDYYEGAGYKPDLILYVDSGGEYFPRGLEELPCPTACYLIDVHRNLNIRLSYVPFFDYIFVAQREYVSHLMQLGYSQVYWLPLACDPDIHGHIEQPKRWDIGFVGQLNSPQRTHRLQLLAEHYKVNEYARYHPKEQIAQVYSAAKIVFNASIGGDLNMRVFEALASGALLLTDRIENGQDELFQSGVHLVEYRNDEEMLEMAAYYLSHDEEREEIARTGMELALAEHTYHRRCQQILETVFGKGQPSLNAMVRKWDNAKRLDAYASIYYRKRAIEPLLDLFEESKNQKGIIYWRILYKAFLSFVRRASRILR